MCSAFSRGRPTRNVSSGVQCGRFLIRLLLDPIAPWIEKEEEDHCDDHDIHVEKDHHRTVVETPACAQTAQCVPGADEGDDRGHKQLERRRIVGPMREHQGRKQTANHKHSATQQRTMTNVKGTGQHYEGNYEYST